MEKRNSGQLFIHSNSLKKNSLSFQPDQAEKISGCSLPKGGKRIPTKLDFGSPGP